MKYIILTLILIITLQGCAQQKQTQMEDELLDYYKQIEHHDNMVSYNALMSSSLCSFEVRVNDDYVYNYYGTGGISFAMPINPNILSAGQQTFSIKILPPKLSDGTFAKTLPKAASFKLSIKGSRITSYGGEDLETVTFELPTVLGTNADGAEDQVYADAGKPIVTYSGTFQSEVPYKLKGYSESLDLRKEDPDELLKEVLAIYKKIGKAVVQKDFNTILSMNENKIKEMAQASYNDSLGMKEDLNTYTRLKIYDHLKLEPLDSFDIEFFGNGKMVGLYKTNSADKGEPALRINYDRDGRTKVTAYYIHLCRPEKGAPLEIIR